jgi:isovaleryl-CoA dehydrogenase
MRGSNTCELVFEDCPIDDNSLVGKEGEGVYILMSGLDYERLVLSAGPVGIMQAVLNEVVPYVKGRRQFNQPLSEFQLVQAAVADLHVALTASRSLVYQTARLADADRLLARGIRKRECAAAILHAAEQATQCALKGIQLLGANGYINDYSLGRLLRDAKLFEIGAGTSEIRRLIIGKELLQVEQ